jgi:anti-sigma B factor antagonist
MNFSVNSTAIDATTWMVELAGEVDLYTAPDLKEELVRVVDEGAQHVVVDLTDTTFIDSTTLGVLLGCLKRLRPAGTMTLVCGNPSIRKIFEITLLDRVFTIVDARDDAVVAPPAR